MEITRRDVDFLWKEYFRDPLLFWDNRSCKDNSKFPDFRHKYSKDPLWLDASCTPSWVQEEFSRNDRVYCLHKAQEFNHSEQVILNSDEYQEFLSSNSLVACLKACAKQKDVVKGSRINAEILKEGLLEKNMYVGNTLVHMYATCGAIEKAQQVFDELPVRDVVSWSALIAGYAQNGYGTEALTCFERMQDEGVRPNPVTFLFILKACGSMLAAEKGEVIHAEISRQGLLKHDLVLGTALVDMYAKCGILAKAQQVFDKLPTHDIVSWNALISGYAMHGQGDKALICFEQMRDENLSPNSVTLICILKACGSVRVIEKGEEIHLEASRQGLLEKDIVLGNTLIDMYAKCGALTKAQELLVKLPVRDVISWNALISGYAQHEYGDEALNCFGCMQDEGLFPDKVTFICVLKACSSIGAPEKGAEIHAEVSRQGLFQKEIVLGNALVDMYAKCGTLAKAQEVFDELPLRDIISWSSLMTGQAQFGHVDVTLDLFMKMEQDHVVPDTVMFAVLLAACSHAGLVDKGHKYFEIMSIVYCMVPTLEVCTCMVDLFSRAGHFDKAIELFGRIQHLDHLSLLLVLLVGCQKWANVNLGRQAFDCALKFDGKHAAAYVCMSNIYADAGMLVEADRVDALRLMNGA